VFDHPHRREAPLQRGIEALTKVAFVEVGGDGKLGAFKWESERSGAHSPRVCVNLTPINRLHDSSALRGFTRDLPFSITINI
jgi:hypothetical protein